MKPLVSAARALHPIAAAGVVVLVFVQIFLISEYVFGDANALQQHKTVGGAVVMVEFLVLVTAAVGWWRDRMQVSLSAGLFVVGIAQVSFAKNLGSSPATHALHGLLALVVVLLAAWIAARKWRGLRPSLIAAGG